MVKYRLLDDNGIVDTMYFNETVILSEEFTTNSRNTTTAIPARGSINQAFKIPKDSDGVYANRLHILCEDEGDFGVIIHAPVGIYTSDALYATDSSALPLNGGLFVGYAATSASTLVGVEVDKTSFLGNMSSGSLTNVPAAPAAGEVYATHAFRTKHLICSIPLLTSTLNTTYSLDDIYGYFTSVDNHKIQLIWTLEEDGGLL